jgi:hypothetical protein
MNPFLAALVAAGYMAAVFLVFGLRGRLVNKTH